jgi:hypothetical protein
MSNKYDMSGQTLVVKAIQTGADSGESSGVAVGVTTPSSNIADMAAPTAYTPHSAGGVTVTSAAATDLDTTAAAVDTLVTELGTARTKINSIIAVLEAHGLAASS